MMKQKNGCMNVVEDKKSEKAFVLEVYMKNYKTLAHYFASAQDPSMEKKLGTENIMGSMSEGKLLFKMALSMIFSVLVSSLYNLVDSIFMRRLGNAALTAISLGAPASSLMVEFSFGLAIGVNTLLYLIFLLAGIFASEAFFPAPNL